MKPLASGALVLALAWPALATADSKVPPTPRQQYEALLKQNQEAEKAFITALQKAKTPEEQLKAMKEHSAKQEKQAARFIELAQAHSKDPVAVDALNQAVFETRDHDGKGQRDRALELLLRDHIDSDRLGEVCQAFTSSYDAPGALFLRSVLQRSPHKKVQREACLALAMHLHQRALVAKMLASNAEMRQRFEMFAGRQSVLELQKCDPAQLLADSKASFERIATEYLVGMEPRDLAARCEAWGRSVADGSEVALRRAMQKDFPREVRGVACLSLALVLKERAENHPEQAAALRRECQELLGRACRDYADVGFGRRTVGKRAERELFEVSHLATGMAAPAVEGVDQDGKPFKLSDYRGKVVLLDFWSEY